MMSCVDWGFWEWERLVMQFVMLIGLFILGRMAKKLLKLGRQIIQDAIADRKARQLALDELKKETQALKIKVEEAAELVRNRELATAGVLSHRLDNIDRELGKNSELTKEASFASKEAAEVANTVNEKISKTNDRIEDTSKQLLEHVKKEEKK